MSESENKTHLEPTQDAGRTFLTSGITGPVVMLNLLRFRKTADYSATPNLAPPEPISGAAAYKLYARSTMPHLKEAGSEMIFLGKGGPFLIGPGDERWDAAMLVRHRSVKEFMAFASNPTYLEGLGHRTAALEDSRLLPLFEGDATEIFADK